MRNELSQSLAPLCLHSRSAMVYRYGPEVLTPVLVLAAAGAQVTVCEVPPEIQRSHIAGCVLLSESVLEHLARQDLFFNEERYLQTYPDVDREVKGGPLQSGFEHYTKFGQFEGRDPASPYSGGLAEFDTIVVHAADLPDFVHDLGGRLQTHQRILVVGGGESLPRGAVTLTAGLSVFYTPPNEWVGLYTPARCRVQFGRWLHLLAPREPDRPAAWPRISIITPSFNQGRFLEATLRSLLAQNYPNMELIVIDGGSKDDSVEIISRYADRLHYWESQPDRGQSHAINKGMQHATGEILTWINSDDRLAPNALFTVAEMFRRHQVDLVIGRCARVMDPSSVPYHFHRCALPLGRPVPLPFDRLLQLDQCWLKGEFFHQPEVFFHRRIWEAAGGQVDEHLYYSMDYDLWVRFAAAGATALSIPEVLAIFRQHADQKTGDDRQPFLPELRRVNNAYRLRHTASPCIHQ